MALAFSIANLLKSDESSPKLEEVNVQADSSCSSQEDSFPLEAPQDEDHDGEGRISPALSEISQDSSVSRSTDNPRPKSIPSRTSRVKKARTSFSDTQVSALEARYRRQRYISPGERLHLARSLGLHDTQVKTWFQNRRMKEKRIVSENELSNHLFNPEIASQLGLPPMPTGYNFGDHTPLPIHGLNPALPFGLSSTPAHQLPGFPLAAFPQAPLPGAIHLPSTTTTTTPHLSLPTSSSIPVGLPTLLSGTQLPVSSPTPTTSSHLSLLQGLQSTSPPGPTTLLAVSSPPQPLSISSPPSLPIPSSGLLGIAQGPKSLSPPSLNLGLAANHGQFPGEFSVDTKGQDRILPPTELSLYAHILPGARASAFSQVAPTSSSASTVY